MLMPKDYDRWRGVRPMEEINARIKYDMIDVVMSKIIKYVLIYKRKLK